MRFLLPICLFVAVLAAAERVWHTGTWGETQIKRPKVVFGAPTRDPYGSGGPRTPPAGPRETRIYTIETDEMRYEIKEETTADTPQLNAVPGGSVTFAVEKKNVYVKDENGRERRLVLTKTTKK
jgi:hypothetical protein